MKRFRLWCASGLLLSVVLPTVSGAQTVVAKLETDPVASRGDAADDPAIWVHPSNPSKSLVIGTDKQRGLYVYGMDGRVRQFLPDGKLNNVDLRYGFPLAGERIDIVMAGNRTDNTMAIYRVDPVTRRLEDVAAGNLTAGLTVYGSCLYHSRATGKFYGFVNSKTGAVIQWRLVEKSGRVGAVKVRQISVGSQPEGCVADDELQKFYLGEEDKGIWKFGAEPNSGASGALVDTTQSSGHLVADVEGLAIYYARGGLGYLIASSQGNNSYVVYERNGGNRYAGTFRIGSGVVDGTSVTDGIDVSSSSLGAGFSRGVFVAQDGSNPGRNQNYKFVPWEDVAGALGLRVDTGFDVREDSPDAQPPVPPGNLQIF